MRLKARHFYGSKFMAEPPFHALPDESEAIKWLKPLFFNEVVHLDKHFKLRGYVAAARIRVFCKALTQSLTILYPPHSI